MFMIGLIVDGGYIPALWHELKGDEGRFRSERDQYNWGVVLTKLYLETSAASAPVVSFV